MWRRRNAFHCLKAGASTASASFMDVDFAGGGSGRLPCDCSCLYCGSGSLSFTSRRRYLKRKFSRMEEDAQLGRLRDVAHVVFGNEVVTLREAICRCQQRIHELCSDLEKERGAAASAASEALSMILRLQREKAEAQMDARQFKRFAEGKMAHDREEIVLLEDLLLERDQAVQSLSCEVEAYRYRLLSYGFSPSPIELSSPSAAVASTGSDVYPLPRSEYAEFPSSADGASDSGGGWGDDMSDRVYTIDAVHVADTRCDVHMSTPRKLSNGTNGIDGGKEKAEIKCLFMRLQALEADRESMRQAIMSMGTDKAQVMMLKEVAQPMSKEMTPEVMVIKKSSTERGFPIKSVTKCLLQWVKSFFFRRKKASRIKYTFGLSSHNAGLLLLLESSPRMRQRRCLTKMLR